MQMETNALCYGFRSFGQLMDDPFLPLLAQLQGFNSEDCPSVEFVTFAWSRCYIILRDHSLIVQGFVDAESAGKKRIRLPFDDELRKVLCLKAYDLFLTERGQCWKYFKSGNCSLVNVLFEDGDQKSNKQRKITDIVSNGNDWKFVLVDTGILYDPHGLPISLPGNKIKKVCCGFEHNVCLSENGSVYVWGSGSRGQLGNGSLLTADEPELLELLDGLFVTDIDAGGWHSVAITGCGALYSWGWNNFGQLGFRSDRSIELNDDDVDERISVLPEPRLVEWSNGAEVVVKQVACGNTHTIVLSDDGLVWGCGSNKYRQLNPHSETEFFDRMICVPVPENVELIRNISCSCWNTTLYTVSQRDIPM